LKLRPETTTLEKKKTTIVGSQLRNMKKKGEEGCRQERGQNAPSKYQRKWLGVRSIVTASLGILGGKKNQKADNKIGRNCESGRFLEAEKKATRGGRKKKLTVI